MEYENVMHSSYKGTNILDPHFTRTASPKTSTRSTCLCVLFATMFPGTFTRGVVSGVDSTPRALSLLEIFDGSLQILCIIYRFKSKRLNQVCIFSVVRHGSISRCTTKTNGVDLQGNVDLCPSEQLGTATGVWTYFSFR